MSQNILHTPIEFLKGVGPQRGDLLKKELNVFCFADLLSFFPFRYVDRTKFHQVAEVRNHADMYIQLQGTISNIQAIGGGKRTTRLTATLTDRTGKIELVWFKGISWLKKTLIVGEEYIVFGKPNRFRDYYNIPHPEMELAKTKELERSSSFFLPVYNSSEKLKAKGLNSKGISKLVSTLLPQVYGIIYENLNPWLIDKMDLISREQAFVNIHYPKSKELLSRAIFRLKFEELFFIQLRLLKLKKYRKIEVKGHKFEFIGDAFNRFYSEKLPFELTNAQKKVIKEIRSDLGSGKQMNRLLQGDVGSGKTIVALMTMLIAIDNNCQACLMAPTEILAKQHFKSITKMLGDLPVKVGLLIGATKKKERTELLSDSQSGVVDILIGTHALIEDAVKFRNLGFVVIDEQHRFGVVQRAKLWKKNTIPPHVLVMTATPIPRTLAMTLYGDLSFSVINELPPGRKPIKTVHRYDKDRLSVFGFMKEQIEAGRQIYVVYPLIEESAKLDLKDLMDGYESIVREFPLPQYAVSVLHGKMKPDDKDYEMQRFLKKETQIMVSTTVIEVGVDVPNASVMIIENAERFGLSQLHQLRGRVGRGADQSYCILMSSYKLTEDARKRINAMVKTNDGFEIAEVDLRLRGPGDIEGTQQSGVLDLKLANLAKDEAILSAARNIAGDILDDDPELIKPKNLVLKKYLAAIEKGKVDWSKIS